MDRWSKEECEKRYVEGEKITFPALSEISGVPLNTLKKWAKGDESGAWSERRQRYQSDLTQQTREKTIAKTSDRLSDELSAISLEHYEAYRVCRRIAQLKSAWMLNQLEAAFEAISHPDLDEDDKNVMSLEMKEAALKDLDIFMVNMLSLVIDRSVRGERMTLSLEYEDINKAIAKVERTGLKVKLRDDKTLARIHPDQRIELVKLD